MRETSKLAPGLHHHCAAAVVLLLAFGAVAQADDVASVAIPASVEGSASSLTRAVLPDPALPGGAALARDLLEAIADTALDEQTLQQLAQHRVALLGPLSIGTPDAGLLVNPLQMPEGPYWKVRNTLEAYATGETIGFIIDAIHAVETRFPGSPRLVVGDLSRRDGGRLNRHRSHQAGRDVDLGFYYARGEAKDFATARAADLDLPRMWALVRALITDTDVERIFVDRSIMSVLHKYARHQEGEDEEWLADVFGRLGEHHKGVVQHERGHKNHLHVRFFNRRAQEYGRIVYPKLLEDGVVPPPKLKHRVRRGETIGGLAARYGTSVAAIRAANALRGTRLRAGRSYLIPIRRVPEAGGPIVVPPRRLPPLPASVRASTAAPELAE